MSQDNKDKENDEEKNQNEVADLRFEIDGLEYKLDRPPKKTGRQKPTITVKVVGSADTPFWDQVNLYSARARNAFALAVAEVFGKQQGEILGHAACILDACERADTSPRQPQAAVLTEARRKAAEKILQLPNLLDRAAKVFDALGYVGEENTKRLVYLVATSRLLDKPLSAILMAQAASGKTELLDTLVKLLPPESCRSLSRLTPAALWYMGEDELRHKVVLVDEQHGATEADYSVRSLQSRGILTLASPIKGKTDTHTVYGPIALLSGTTSSTLNDENLSRLLELPLDDSPEQTKRIHDAQRRAAAGEGLKDVDLEPWQDAQRLLEPADVVIEFAPKIKFSTRLPKDRRDFPKVIQLIKAHALLCQFQRERNKDGAIVATVKGDYLPIFDLLVPVLEKQIDGLAPRAVKLYRALLKDKRASVTKEEITVLMGCSYMTAQRSVEDLLRRELLVEVEKGPPAKYSVIRGTLLDKTSSLTPPEELE